MGMMLAPQFAVTDVALEETEVIFIFVLIVVAVMTAAYIRRLRSELNRHRRKLDEQSHFNEKLNATVDRILQIEQEGSIDSNRRKNQK
jgi:predicted Holliday junction resolvase-like endonuclease